MQNVAKQIGIGACGVLLTCASPHADAADAPEQTTVAEVRQALTRLPKTHPRLFTNAAGLVQLQQNRRMPDGKAFEELICHEANLILGDPPATRILEGKRMLTVSRLVLYRMTTLGMACLLTGDKQYAARGIAELEAVAAFPDWNPSHFLDTAEMTLAVAIGLDWFDRELTAAQREKIVRAVIEKGLKPSFDAEAQYLVWVSGKNNWTQVCHAGLTAGALAVCETDPELAARVIQRAVVKVPAAMRASYAPNGAYPEGPSYWMYGTEYQLVLLEVLNSALGADFGLSREPGFDKTGEYLIAMQAPSGFMFNYGDGSFRRDFGPARLWWIGRFQRPDCYSAWTRKLFESYLKPRRKTVTNGGGHRLLPLAMFWLHTLPTRPAVDQPLSYGSGDEAANPVVMHRTDSGDKAVYLAAKGGSPGKSHCHMDGGSFILEADGVRWVLDLPGENYLKQEQTGVDLWNMDQESQRWSLFRLGVQSHSIIVIDNHRQEVDGKGHIVEFSGTPGRQSTLLDLSELYRRDAGSVRRRLTLRPDRAVTVEDRLTGLHPGARVRWQFCTDATPQTDGGDTLVLSRGKASMRVKATAAVPVHWRVTPETELLGPGDTPFGNLKRVSFELPAPPDGELELNVEFTPGKE